MPASDSVYLMLNHRNGYIKIGISNNPVYREKTLQAEEPEIILLATATGGRSLERGLHHEFDHRRLRGEWFRLAPDELEQIVVTYGFRVAQNYLPSYHAFVAGKTLEEWFKEQLLQKRSDESDPIELYISEEMLDEVVYDAL